MESVEDLKCEMRCVTVDSGGEDGRHQAEDLGGTDHVVHWM